MKHIFWLAAATLVVLAFATLTGVGKSTNRRTDSAILSATVSDQDRPIKKPSSVSAEEEQQVRKMLTDRREAFSRHDVETGCSYFADEADFVNVAGSWWRGRQEIEKNMTELYAGMFKNIHFNDSEISIRFITPDVAVEHFKWEATGIVGPDGSPRPPRQGIATFIAVKENGKWLVEVGNNNEFTASIARRLSKETPATKPEGFRARNRNRSRYSVSLGKQSNTNQFYWRAPSPPAGYESEPFLEDERTMEHYQWRAIYQASRILEKIDERWPSE